MLSIVNAIIVCVFGANLIICLHFVGCLEKYSKWNACWCRTLDKKRFYDDMVVIDSVMYWSIIG